MPADFATLSRSIELIRSRSPLQPEFALLLGTGLGGVAERIEAELRLPYAQLPGLPAVGAQGHAGELILGRFAGRPVVAFSGRAHLYEGYAPSEVVAPVRLAKLLGASCLVMGSAVGGLDPRHQVGDLVLIDDHLNLMGSSPLTGANDDRFGPRWPDMIAPYNAELNALAARLALARGIPLHRGVYAGVLGPQLETRAEYRMLRRLGADVVGMSTVPEAIAAVHAGLRTLTFAIVTDHCLPDALEPVNIARIIAAAQAAEPVLAELVAAVVAEA